MKRRFEPETHTYTLDDRQIPSVTQVLHGVGMLPDFSRFDPFYAARGTAVHSAIRLRLLQRLDRDSLDEYTGPFMDRFERLLEVVEIEPVFLEEPLFCETYGYGGSPDCFCLWNGKPTIPDWKTGQMLPGYATQVAGGYAPLLEQAAEDGLIPADASDVRRAKIAIVTLTTELPKQIWIQPDGQRELFRSALAVYNWRQQNMKGAAA